MSIKKLALASVLAISSFAITQDAQAYQMGTYFRFEGGYVDPDPTYGIGTAIDPAAEIQGKENFAASAAVGYLVDHNWRTEFGFTYVRPKNRVAALTGHTIVEKTTSYAAMMNLFYDFNDIHPSFKPYMMAGAGVARTKAEFNLDTTVPADVFDSNETKTDFAFNAGVGIRMNIGRDMDFDISGKYFNFGEAGDVGSATEVSIKKLRGYMVTGGIILHF